MSSTGRYFHDKVVLLLLSISGFMVLLSAAIVLLRLDNSKSGSYIIQYRPSQGLSAYKAGEATELFAFIAFAALVFALHLIISLRIYHVRRYAALAILSLGLLLLVLSAIVANALLVLR